MSGICWLIPFYEEFIYKNQFKEAKTPYKFFDSDPGISTLLSLWGMQGYVFPYEDDSQIFIL